MIFLLLSIVSSVLINFIFKYFSRFGIHNRQAITFNYLTCVGVGLIAERNSIQHFSIIHEPWLPVALMLGVLFIVIFLFIARTAQDLGVSVAAISAKMSVIFPVISGFLLFKEDPTPAMVLGIVVSIPSVLLSSIKSNTRPKGEKILKKLWLPLMVFTGSGIIDSGLKWIEQHPGQSSSSLPGLIIFSVAGLIGLAVTIHAILFRKELLEKRNILAGIVLGIPNYFSIYFLLKALNVQGMSSLYLFPVNNIGVVLLATMGGALLFQEKFSLPNKIGILLCVVSIILMNL